MKTTIKIMIVLAFFTAPILAGRLPLNDDEKAWLKTVELIITADERKYFKKKCSTHIDRQDFIDLFWAKRDPDLTDGINPFKDEYFARMDYVATHYREFVGRPPRTDRGFVYMLLGQPDKVEFRADPMLVGFNYRNSFPQYPPELWVYNDIDFGNGRRRAIVQMIPKNSFGDYVALVDAQLDRLLRRIKYDFVIHPELEQAPSKSVEVTDLQPLTGDEDMDDMIDDEGESSSTKNVIESKPLPVPVAKAMATSSRTVFNNDIGNPLNIEGNSAQFFSAAGKSLVIMRFGFPLTGMTTTKEKTINATFEMRYAITNDKGQQIVADTRNQELVFPNQGALDRQKHFAHEVAKLIEPGNYVAQVQIKSGQGSVSYWELPIRIDGLPTERPGITPVVLMVPDVDPKEANLKLRDRAYSPKLNHRVLIGDRIYPMFEFVHLDNEPQLKDIRIMIVAGDQIVKSWNLYPEEMTALGTGAVICHPEISTSKLKQGVYQLRAEIELPDGDILITETELVLTKD